MARFLAVLFLLLSPLVAPAAVLDVNAFYLTDAIAAETDNSHAATLYNIFIGFDLDKRGRYQVGWNYAGHSTEGKIDTTTVKYSSTQMGPGFIAYFNKNRTFRFSFAYNLVTTADYDVGSGTVEEWRGAAMNADLGYQLRFDGAFSLGIRLNYSSASYSEKLIETTNEKVSFKKNLIYPSVALTFEL